jgi:hypothetical protein
MIQDELSIQSSPYVDLHHIASQQGGLLERFQRILRYIFVRRTMAQQLYAPRRECRGMRDA